MENILLDLPLAFETEHLLIRTPRAGDGAEMHAAYLESRPRLVRWFRWAQSEDTPEDYEILSRQKQGEYLARENFMLLLFERESGAFVGGTGLNFRKQEPLILEIGYWLRNGYEGKGYMSEAVQALLRIAFENLGAVKVLLRADAENLRSQAVALRNGFTYEGTMRWFEPQHNQRDRMIDMCFFGMLASEYPLPAIPRRTVLNEEERLRSGQYELPEPFPAEADYKKWLTLCDVPEELETDRLRLRICADDDAPQVYAAVEAGQERMGKYLRWVAEADTPQKVLAWVRRNRARFYKHEDFSYLLFDKTSGALLGNAGMGLSHTNCPSFEIGYWLVNGAEGKGYAAEAVRALVELAFGQLRANRVEIVAQADNRPSRGVAERLGFTFELLMRHQGRNARKNSPEDLAFYSLIRPEYEARREAFRVLR